MTAACLKLNLGTESTSGHSACFESHKCKAPFQSGSPNKNKLWTTNDPHENLTIRNLGKMLTLILSFAKCLFTFLVTFFKYILLYWGIGGQSPGILIWSTQWNAGVFWSVLFIHYLYKSVIWILVHDLKFSSTSVVCVYVVSSWENTNIRNVTLRIVLLLFNTSSGTLFYFYS